MLGVMLAGGEIPSLRVSLLGLLAALAGYLCVYSLNDLLDLKSDREELRKNSLDPLTWEPAVSHVDITTLRHPVAAGALSLWAAITWVSILGIVGLAAAYLLRPLCAWLFIACAVLEVLYCVLRRRTWLKAIPAGVLVALGGLAGWFAVENATWGTLAFFVLLFVWEITGRNLSNDLADVTHDRLLGITTLASTHGVHAAVITIAGGSFLMPVIALLQPGPWPTRALLALAALATMSAPAVVLMRNPTEDNAQRYFNRASFFPIIGAALLIISSLLHD